MRKGGSREGSMFSTDNGVSVRHFFGLININWRATPWMTLRHDRNGHTQGKGVVNYVTKRDVTEHIESVNRIDNSPFRCI